MSGFISKGKEKFHRLEDKFGHLPGRDRWSKFVEEHHRKSPKERAAERDALNTETMLTKAQEMNEDNVTDLEVCDFFIARFVMDKEEEKYHDHFAFVKEKDSEGVEVIFVSDIMKKKPEELTWTFEMLRTNIAEGELEIIKFDFMDMQDNDELILQRAGFYVIPNKEVRPLHFAYFCVFGVKEPVFSEDHLSLCNDKTLLLLRTEEEDTLVLLHKAREGQFTVSLKDSDSDIKVVSYTELMNMTSGTMSGLYYYPGLKLESLEELYKDDHSVGHDVAHTTVEVSAIHVVEHSAKEGIEHGMVPLLAPELAGAASHALGGALHGFIAGAMASVTTHKADKKEKDYKESGGIKGFSRTRRNKEVSGAWTGAAVGTAGSMAGGIGAAALIGQVMIPIPGVGLAAGIAGGVVGGLVATYASKKASNKIYDTNMQRKCPLC